MKVIGTIDPEWVEEEGHVLNPDYIGGKIIELTSKEASLLAMLQESVIGKSWNWMNMDRVYPKDGNMSDAFYCVYAYVNARFALNDFQKAIDGLKDMLTQIERNEDDISG